MDFRSQRRQQAAGLCYPDQAGFWMPTFTGLKLKTKGMQTLTVVA
jgi:hypothetical protein